MKINRFWDWLEKNEESIPWPFISLLCLVFLVYRFLYWGYSKIIL